ncbi:cobaltochelatase subunit [Luteitalea pratensis]|uniref:Cobaltochelatase subunit n=1 Tax=Luteitalea pratensis TaxID=1855912 RepID=A0A143PG78_LUTPR|nr:von Willebrand factor type A domain-containing protein [Luteitalea pratensis]AMY07521.1 cobaltochelatase subunit [Luteitalea pratensis]
MHRSLVAAALIAVCAMVGYAAVPLGVSPRITQPAATGNQAPRDRPGQAAATQRPAQQAAVATIEGQVLDATGAPMTGAVVDAWHEASGWRALALTDKEGRFRLQAVPAGSVTMTVRRGPIEFAQVIQVGTGMGRLTLRDARPDASDMVQARSMAGAMAARQASPAPATSAPMYATGKVYTQEMRSRGVGVIPPPTSMDAYARVDPSGFRRVGDAPLSTFSVDVDTASYTNARRFLVEAGLPPADAVRVEEWINYFPYAYASPEGHDAFRVNTQLTACPWNAEHQLLRIGVRGREVPTTNAPARNLVFLVDVSGSMLSRDKLPLVRTSLKMLADQLTARDRIALVVYAGRTETVLPSTPGNQRERIHGAIEQLEAGGSTNGAGGIQLAYQAAREGFIAGGVNRVVLATDGDFNVGVTSIGELARLIEKERESGVFLSVLGVGRGNLKDTTLEMLADRGNGNYAYVDSLQEARRALVEQVGATLVTIAKDVKLQVEFNPRHVAAYRLIGYENRALRTEDFADDARDAGEIGAGHTVTALYEIVPPGRDAHLPGTTTLRYQQTPAPRGDGGDELATVSVRHKQPDGGASALQAHRVAAKVVQADTDAAFAAAVAEAALVLRKDPLATRASLASATTRAAAALGADKGGWRAEFVRLMQLAASLQALEASPTSEQ